MALIGISELVADLKALGIFDFYLPFVILFAMLYGLLTKSKIFGNPSDNKSVNRINLVIALSAALFVMAYTPVGPAAISLGTFLSQFFGGTLIILVTILSFGLILVLLGASMGKDLRLESGVKMVILLVAILVIGIFVSSGGLALFPGIGNFPDQINNILPGVNTQDLAIIILVILTGIVFWIITREDNENKRKGKNQVGWELAPRYE